MRSDRSRRLFFALWPTEALRRAIHRATAAIAERARGRVIPPENFHITLIFLGSVTEDRFEAACRAGAATTASRFEICFDQLQSLRRSGVLCLTATNPPLELTELHDCLRACLLVEQFEIEEGRLLPHVTLVRRVPRSVPRTPLKPLSWAIEEFVLVESHASAQGSEYEVLERWPLGGSG